MQNTGSAILIDTYSKAWGGAGLSPHTCKHNNGANMSFADGRAEHWKWKDPRTIKVMKHEIDVSNYPEASIDNPDFMRLLPAIRGPRDRQF